MPMTLHDTISRSLDYRLTETGFPGLGTLVGGKVRDSYILPDGRRILVTTDRQSAFDRVLAAVPFKGQVLTQIARFWFDRTRDICANHVLAYPDPNVLVATNLEMFGFEVVVRDYLTGSTSTSAWTAYAGGSRLFCGNPLPDGLVKNDRLPATILTPSTKPADGAHDVSVAPEALIGQGLVSAGRWREIADTALALFARGREIAAANGLILVDTKYEFGLDGAGRLVLADEIHTPDSSRYWIAASYPERHAAGLEPDSLDKEFLRLWIRERCDPYQEPIPEIPDETIAEFSERYVRLYQTVTGLPFAFPDTAVPIRDRVLGNLTAWLAKAPYTNGPGQ